MEEIDATPYPVSCIAVQGQEDSDCGKPDCGSLLHLRVKRSCKFSRYTNTNLFSAFRKVNRE